MLLKKRMNTDSTGTLVFDNFISYVPVMFPVSS